MGTVPLSGIDLNIIPFSSRIKDHVEAVVSDEAFGKRGERWSEGTPDTKEGYFFRQIFDGEAFSYTDLSHMLMSAKVCTLLKQQLKRQFGMYSMLLVMFFSLMRSDGSLEVIGDAQQTLVDEVSAYTTRHMKPVDLKLLKRQHA
jgi:hypothetical protein